MKTNYIKILTAAILFCGSFINTATAQIIYVGTSSGNIYEVNTSTCTNTLKYHAPAGAWFDIAMCSGDPNIIYGIQGTGWLYTIDISNGTSANLSFESHSLNALVCDGNGTLYGANGGGQLWSYTISSGTWTMLAGSLGGYGSGGDLTFFNGKLYMSTNTNQLVQIDLTTYTTTLVGSLSIPNVYGVGTLSEGQACHPTNYTMIGTGVTQLYTVDASNGTCTQICANAIPGGETIYGATSIYEGKNGAPLTVTISPSSPSVCDGQPVTLTASGGATTYTWSPSTNLNTTSGAVVIASPSSSTPYQVIGDNGSCKDTAYVTVNVNTTPTASITGTSTICSGQHVTLTGGGTGNYTWSTNETTTTINVAPTTPTTYTLVVDASGCKDTTTKTIAVNPSPNANITGNTTICKGSNTTLTATGGGTYAWSTNETTDAITVSPTNNATYTVVVSNSLCLDTASILVNVSPGPTANAGADVFISSGSSTQLLATGNGTYLWSPSTGLSCTTCANPIASPTQNTTYCVKVTDNNQCTDSACVQVLFDIFFPNVITPNGDGKNDVFLISGLQSGIAPIKIYNRWGTKVFESSGYKNDWDAKNLNDGVYYYVLTYPANNKTYNGYVQVITTR